MSYIKRILKNAALTYSLKEQYFKFTSRIGLLGVFAGMMVMVFVIIWLAKTLDIDASMPLSQVPNGLGYLFLVFLPVVFVICVMLCCMLFALLASTFLVATNQMSLSEAKKYVVFGEYPKTWFKNS